MISIDVHIAYIYTHCIKYIFIKLMTKTWLNQTSVDEDSIGNLYSKIIKIVEYADTYKLCVIIKNFERKDVKI